MKICSLFVLELMIFFDFPLSGNAYISQYPHTEDSLKIIEKVYLHVDRESYYPGDDIWFKAYLVEATDWLLTDHSTNLHVELISPGSEITDSRVVRMTGGLGNGDFHLAENLKSGRYMIRAYTNYMRNFGDSLFFHKDIIIINSTDSNKSFQDSVKAIIDKPEIAFFPEGGSLVDDVLSVIAFKAVDAYGNAIDVSGEIYSSTDEKVTTFISTHKGMGIFSLKPLSGINYYTIIKNRNGDFLRYDLPESFSTGVVLTISKNQEQELLLNLKTNPSTFNLLKNSDLTLNVSARNLTFKTYSLRMQSLNSFLSIPTDDLPDGIFMLTLSGIDKIPLCERLVFIQNGEDVNVKIETDKAVYKQRDSVSVKISLVVNSRDPQNAFLSLSATDYIFTDNSSGFPSTISSWFLLESDVRGVVEEPSYYFDPSNANRLNDLDILLLTQGWRDFEWKYKNMNYPPEYGFTISGRARKKFADVPLKNSYVTIGLFKGGKPLLYIVPTDSSGRFYIEKVDFSGEAKLIASVTGEKDNLKGWLLLDSVNYSSARVKERIAQTRYIQKDEQLTGDDQLTGKKMPAFIQYAEFKSSIERKYKLSDTITPGEVTITAKKQDWTESAKSRSRHYLMGTPDTEMEITPELEAYGNVFQLVDSRILSHYKLKGYFNRGLSPGIHNPIYLIDGVKASKDDVRALPMKWVERIDVLKTMAAYSIFGYSAVSSDPRDSTSGDMDGVISIILRNDFADYSSPAYHSVNVNFSGYNEPRIFYSPKHHETLESDYKPDLRTTLFWEPDIAVENNRDVFLNYYNADNSSIIRVIVEGITTNGIPVTGKTEYEVK